MRRAWMSDDTTNSAPVLEQDQPSGEPLWVHWLQPAGVEDQRFPEGHTLTVGRGADTALVIQAREVSRRHASLTGTLGGVLVRDLGSRNGTWANGVRVQRSMLKVGDVLRMGQSLAIVTPSSRNGAFPEIGAGLYGGQELATTMAVARRAAGTMLPVVVVGETGVGKELVARAVHDWSGRTGRLVSTNCAALTESLAESQLFGHRQGAFTGANRNVAGLFQAAQGGTLFLDEIPELPLSVQAKLLRALESGEIWPVGAQGPTTIDVRVVCATQTPLRVLVGSGAFRQDLYARLDGVPLRVPALRERRADIVPLFLHFLSHAAGGRVPPIAAELLEALLGYPWPMNVRELRQVAERLIALHGHEAGLLARHLPRRMLRPDATPTAPSDPSPPADSSQGNSEIDKLIRALERYHGNVSRACSSISMSRQRAYRLLRSSSEVDLRSLREY